MDLSLKLGKGFLIPADGHTAVNKAVLVLEDGTVIRGDGFGAIRKVSGEVVFNTGMVGYPESITDPSYAGQILIQTYPLIGNYGVAYRHLESDRPKIEGYVVHELCRQPSHWACDIRLDEWLATNGVPGISDVDTRLLTQKIRTKGTMLGILSVYEDWNEPDINLLLMEAKTIPDPNKRKLAYEVATKTPRFIKAGDGPNAVLVDCGVKTSIVRALTTRGVNILVVPPTMPAQEILESRPAGVVFSNGPGDPMLYEEVIATMRTVAESMVPVMGICLGAQILALAFGGATYKLKFGHRGQNHPCIEVHGERCYITSQNHGYAVNADSLEGTGLEVTLLNANDGSVEGIRHVYLPAFAVQFHPEASPGPNDTNFFFDFFVEKMRKRVCGHA